MAFGDDLKQFSARVLVTKDGIANEESTKMSLIVPFFQLLGYDVFNPLEFCPEYTADVGIKKGEKVDYAILSNGKPVILIEAKAISIKLEKHDSQLFRYFSTTNARFAILTNGISYKFYTDLSERNKMDREPFYEFNILNLSDDDIREIQKFCKQNFDEEVIFDNASILKYSNLFRDIFSAQIASPSDEFVRFFLKSTYAGTKTQGVIDKFRPVLKKSLNDYIDELVKGKMSSIVNESGYVSTSRNVKENPTDEEMDFLLSIKTILKDEADMADITHKKTDTYFAVLYKGNSRKWICRVMFGVQQITLIIPDKNKAEMRYKLDSIDLVENYSNLIKEAFRNYSSSPSLCDTLITRWGIFEKPNPYVVRIDRNYYPDHGKSIR